MIVTIDSHGQYLNVLDCVALHFTVGEPRGAVVVTARDSSGEKSTVTLRGVDDPQAIADKLQEALNEHLDSDAKVFAIRFHK